jgi:PAS domain S-box-containing protein
LDVETVVKASQALSSEIVLPTLIETLMRIAVKHAGAERGLLILLRGDEPHIEAEATTGHGRVDVTVRQAPVTPSDLPQSVLHYVMRSRERVVLDDASTSRLYSEDEYVRQICAKSVLCVPIVKQTRVVGALYLENNLTPRAFTPEQVAVLELLASQAAISLENARLYSDLQRSEAFLVEGQGISLTGSFGWKPRSGEIYWSVETFRIFGCDQTAKPTVAHVLQRVHPEDAALVKDTIERAAQDGKDLDFERRLLMPDGSVKHVRVVGHAERDASGELEYVGAVMDVTAAKEAKDKIRVTIETVPAFIWTARPDGWVDFISQRWLDYTGMTLEQGLGWGRERAFHRDEVERIGSQWRAALAWGKPLEGETRIRRFDGEYRWFLSRAFPLRDRSGRVLGWYGNDIDIHDSKQAEEKLRQTETELRQLIDVIPQQVVVFDSNWIPLFANLRELEYTGLTLQEVQSKDAVARTFHPEDWKKLEVIRERGRSEGAPFEMEARIRGRDGQYRWFLIKDNPLRDEQGRVLQWYGTRTDIEDRKRAEETVRQAQADLARVNRVTTMGELTASLAHEVKQPIAAAMTNANTCILWLDRETPDIDEARAAVLRVVEDGRRATEIISRIRLLFTKGTPQRERIDVNELIREMIVLLRSEATRSAISVRTALAADLPHVMGDRVQLQQVLMNLIMNGIDAMKEVDGARELAITSTRAEPRHVLVSVSDTGLGLPQERVDQIFKAFFTTKQHGTGMGLSISRSIVESHGGRLWADDKETRGAIFHVVLPANADLQE